MAETVVQVTLNVTVSTPDDGAYTALDLVKLGLDETIIPVPPFASSKYSFSRPVAKGIIEKE